MGEPSCWPERGALPKTVLVVEDEVFIRMNTAEALMNAGFLVVQAATADEALQVLSSSVPVDLVFTDIQMPGSIDGLGLAHCVQSEWPRIKIVLASGHLQMPHTFVPDASFSKPYLLPAVIDCIRRLLAEAHNGQS